MANIDTNILFCKKKNNKKKQKNHTHTKDKKTKRVTYIIYLLEFLIDNIFVMVGGHVVHISNNDRLSYSKEIINVV